MIEHAYLDTSAFLKLILEEVESATFAKWLERWPQRISSRLLKLEAIRVVRRSRPAAIAVMHEKLAGVSLISIDDDIVELGALLEPIGLRSLDAIHLATAARIASGLGVFVTYDHRMIDAAHRLGLPVASPA